MLSLNPSSKSPLSSSLKSSSRGKNKVVPIRTLERMKLDSSQAVGSPPVVQSLTRSTIRAKSPLRRSKAAAEDQSIYRSRDRRSKKANGRDLKLITVNSSILTHLPPSQDSNNFNKPLWPSNPGQLQPATSSERSLPRPRLQTKPFSPTKHSQTPILCTTNTNPLSHASRANLCTKTSKH